MLRGWRWDSETTRCSSAEHLLSLVCDGLCVNLYKPAETSEGLAVPSEWPSVNGSSSSTCVLNTRVALVPHLHLYFQWENIAFLKLIYIYINVCINNLVFAFLLERLLSFFPSQQRWRLRSPALLWKQSLTCSFQAARTDWKPHCWYTQRSYFSSQKLSSVCVLWIVQIVHVFCYIFHLSI